MREKINENQKIQGLPPGLGNRKKDFISIFSLIEVGIALEPQHLQLNVILILRHTLKRNPAVGGIRIRYFRTKLSCSLVSLGLQSSCWILNCLGQIFSYSRYSEELKCFPLILLAGGRLSDKIVWRHKKARLFLIYRNLLRFGGCEIGH